MEHGSSQRWVRALIAGAGLCALSTFGVGCGRRFVLEDAAGDGGVDGAQEASVDALAEAALDAPTNETAPDEGPEVLVPDVPPPIDVRPATYALPAAVMPEPAPSTIGTGSGTPTRGTCAQEGAGMTAKRRALVYLEFRVQSVMGTGVSYIENIMRAASSLLQPDGRIDPPATIDGCQFSMGAGTGVPAFMQCPANEVLVGLYGSRGIVSGSQTRIVRLGLHCMPLARWLAWREGDALPQGPSIGTPASTMVTGERAEATVCPVGSVAVGLLHTPDSMGLTAALTMLCQPVVVN